MKSHNYQFQTPDELTMLEVCWVEPVEKVPEDDFWVYEFGDDYDIRLTLSFDVFERSIQTQLSLKGEIVSTVVQEGATLLKAETLKDGQPRISGHCKFRDAETKLSIFLKPRISVDWSTLRDTSSDAH